jgi:hypothetical protein
MTKNIREAAAPQTAVTTENSSMFAAFSGVLRGTEARIVDAYMRHPKAVVYVSAAAGITLGIGISVSAVYVWRDIVLHGTPVEGAVATFVLWAGWLGAVHQFYPPKSLQRQSEG